MIAYSYIAYGFIRKLNYLFYLIILFDSDYFISLIK